MWEFLNTIDPETGMSLYNIISMAIVAIVSALIWRLVSLANAAIDKYLPPVVANRIDETTMRAIHSAAVTAVRKVMLEGKDPRMVTKELVDYMKQSAKDGFENALKNRTMAEVEDTFREIALSKIPEVLPSFITAGIKVNLPGLLTEPMVIADPKVGPDPAVKQS